MHSKGKDIVPFYFNELSKHSLDELCPSSKYEPNSGSGNIIMYYDLMNGDDFISTRAITMQLIDSYIAPCNTFIPFNSEISNWATLGSDYLIKYDNKTQHFLVPIAAENDYFINWEVCIKTVSMNEFPIIGLDLSYQNQTRFDYIIGPSKTIQLINTSIYHIPNSQGTDELLIGLKVIGPENHKYWLGSDSLFHITANISILGL